MTTLSRSASRRRLAAVLLASCAVVALTTASAEAMTSSSADHTIELSRDEITNVVKLDVYREGLCQSYLGLKAHPCSESMNECAITQLTQLRPVFMEFDAGGHYVRCEPVP